MNGASAADLVWGIFVAIGSAMAWGNRSAASGRRDYS